MKKTLNRYDKIYNQRIKALTVDWCDRRKAIVLPEDQRIGDREYPDQQQLATMVRLSLGSYGRQERGVVQPSRDSFRRVMEVFDSYGV